MVLVSMGHIGMSHRSNLSMKIRLTSEEFKAILSKHFNHEVSEFEIVQPDPSPLGKYIRQAVVDPFDKNKFVSNIKSLRAAVMELDKYITLIEGRWAVDNWTTFIRFVDEHNRLPESGYGTGKNLGVLI